MKRATLSAVATALCRRVFFALFILNSSFIILPSAFSSPVTIGWRAENQPTGIAGYRVHYGSAPRTYTTHLDLGPAISTTLNPPGLIYILATAYDSAGRDFLFSNELRSDAPTPTPTPAPAPTPTFTITLTPATITIPHLADKGSCSVQLSGTGFIGPVTLSVTGLPDGVAATFTSNPILSKTTLKLSIDDCLPRGNYLFTVKGTGGGLTRTVSATLVKQ